MGKEAKEKKGKEAKKQASGNGNGGRRRHQTSTGTGGGQQTRGALASVRSNIAAALSSGNEAESGVEADVARKATGGAASRSSQRSRGVTSPLESSDSGGKTRDESATGETTAAGGGGIGAGGSSSTGAAAVASMRVLVTGVGDVGKTALLVRFLTKRFIYEYESGVPRVYGFDATFEAGTYAFPRRIEFIDRSILGEDDTIDFSDPENNRIDGYILVYSITNRRSFSALTRMIYAIERQLIQCSAEAPVVATPLLIVGTKSDLEHLREVTRADVERLSGAIVFRWTALFEAFGDSKQCVTADYGSKLSINCEECSSVRDSYNSIRDIFSQFIKKVFFVG